MSKRQMRQPSEVTNAIILASMLAVCDADVIPCVGDDKWKGERRKHIGASEAAVVIGRSPWMNEVELWDEKCGRKVREFSNADTERGHKSEYHIRDLYGIEMGYDIVDGTRVIIRSKKYPWAGCTLDGAYVDKDGRKIVLEIKSVRYSHGEWANDRIPDYYFTQVLHQLAVTGFDEAVLLVRFARNEGYEDVRERCYHIVRSDVEDQIAKLMEKEEKFWSNYVVGGKRPALRMPKL